MANPKIAALLADAQKKQDDAGIIDRATKQPAELGDDKLVGVATYCEAFDISRTTYHRHKVAGKLAINPIDHSGHDKWRLGDLKAKVRELTAAA